MQSVLRAIPWVPGPDRRIGRILGVGFSSRMARTGVPQGRRHRQGGCRASDPYQAREAAPGPLLRRTRVQPQCICKRDKGQLPRGFRRTDILASSIIPRGEGPAGSGFTRFPLHLPFPQVQLIRVLSSYLQLLPACSNPSQIQAKCRLFETITIISPGPITFQTRSYQSRPDQGRSG